MRRLLQTAEEVAALTVATACGTLAGEQGPDPLRPMPSGVPTQPRYADADTIVAKLAEEGVPCEVIRRPEGDRSVGQTLTCEAELQGIRFTNEIHAYNLKKWDRSRIGDAIASSLEYPFNHTVVAAGNWYMSVQEADFAPKFADALGGVVLRPSSAEAVTPPPDHA